MNPRTRIGLILFSVVTSIVGAQMLVVIPDEIRATNAWMLCDAVSKILFVGAFWLHAKGTLKHLLFGVLFIAINNLVDELFFDPMCYGFNELVLLLIIASYTTFKIYE
jgi:hypothetical protein